MPRHPRLGARRLPTPRSSPRGAIAHREHKTLRGQIAAQVGLSQMQVSRLLPRTLAKVRRGPTVQE
jgi:hypothetical protein